MELHHPIMSKLWDLGGRTKRKKDKTAANGMIISGLHRNNILKATVHWLQYFQRIIRDPKIDGIKDKPTFKENIYAGRVHAII